MPYKTEQESFWAGNFGNAYRERSQVDQRQLATSARIWGNALTAMQYTPKSALELGCNIGRNLQALRFLAPSMEIDGVEINEDSAAEARKLGTGKVYTQSILDFVPERQYEMVFTRGVLIHLNPEALPQVYHTMYTASTRYICLFEYYNPTPVTVSYRNHEERLFKRDFAGELMDTYPDLRLVWYTFYYHRDILGLDDGTFFVLEKQKNFPVI